MTVVIRSKEDGTVQRTLKNIDAVVECDNAIRLYFYLENILKIAHIDIPKCWYIVRSFSN